MAVGQQTDLFRTDTRSREASQRLGSLPIRPGHALDAVLATKGLMAGSAGNTAGNASVGAQYTPSQIASALSGSLSLLGELAGSYSAGTRDGLFPIGARLA
jgi:hypothetical protein